jgi:hypothetical protein
MDKLLPFKLREWRGKRYLKEAAAILDIPLPTYRKYESGERHPNNLAEAELKRRMSQCQSKENTHGLKIF